MTQVPPPPMDEGDAQYTPAPIRQGSGEKPFSDQYKRPPTWQPTPLAPCFVPGEQTSHVNPTHTLGEAGPAHATHPVSSTMTGV
jgi:hypothetical protein